MSSKKENSVIIGFGHALPSYEVDNHYFERFLDTSDEWIRSRTGIAKRRFALPALGETNTTLSVESAQKAMHMAGVESKDIDFIIGATLTASEIMPSMACRVQSLLGIKDVFAFDLSAACSGFLFGLGVADKFLQSGSHQTGLVIGTECLSSITNNRDRGTCVLFGDGSGAAIIQRRASAKMRPFGCHMVSDGSFAELLYLPGGGSDIRSTDPMYTWDNSKVSMKGNELFKVAVRCMKQSVLECLERSGVGIDQIDMLVPHQANERIIDRLCEELSFPADKVIKNIDQVGNTSAASIPIACSMAIEEGKLRSGDLVLSTSFGGGLNFGACLFPVEFARKGK